VRFGNVILGPRVFAGHWWDLTAEERTGLLELAGMERPRPTARGRGEGELPAKPWEKARGTKAGGPERKLARAKAQRRKVIDD
jgi:23S rRNA pseudouridine2605 synthase